MRSASFYVRGSSDVKDLCFAALEVRVNERRGQDITRAIKTNHAAVEATFGRGSSTVRLPKRLRGCLL
jgi:hypothetical protein